METISMFLPRSLTAERSQYVMAKERRIVAGRDRDTLPQNLPLMRGSGFPVERATCDSM